MKVLQINTVYDEGSTGKIVKALEEGCISQGIDCISAFRCSKVKKSEASKSIEISTPLDSKIHGFLSRLTMFKGCFSVLRTARFLKKVKTYSPDLVHLHNLHGSYVNLPLLFWYIKKEHIPAVWTLHDCWNFTGICSHFTLAGCDRWKEKCYGCPQRKQLSLSPLDFSGNVWSLKKKWFTGIEESIVVTPSNWLKELVEQSFLNEYPIRTIYNGIDLDAFSPTASSFRESYKLQDKKIVLGVAFNWGYAKGLDVFNSLADMLPEDYKIVLVGTSSANEKEISPKIVSIPKTANQKELAEIYTAADVFVNTTREEVLGLVNIEALACGTSVITFKTGGSPECIDETCGCIVETNDEAGLLNEIIRICSERPYQTSDCIARAKMFSKEESINKYINLYREILESKED